MRIPTWRWVRTASCAAAIDCLRPMAIGKTVRGKRTKPRTGTMTRAFAGSSGAEPWEASGARKRSGEKFIRVRASGGGFSEAHKDATLERGAGDGTVSSSRQRDTSLETSLRQLQPMDERILEFRGQRAGA